MNKIVYFREWEKLAYKFCPEHSPFVKYDYANISTIVEETDAYVQIDIKNPYFSHCHEHELLYDFIEMTKKPKLVIDSPVFQKCTGKYFRYAWNSYLYNEAKYGPSECSDDRWNMLKEQYNIDIKPWRKKRGEHILILLPYNVSSSIIRLIDKYGTIFNWLHGLIKEIRMYTNMPIRVRPHPKPNIKPRFGAGKLEMVCMNFFNVHWSDENTFEDDLEDAHCAIGWTSNALTEAACLGVPVYAMSAGAMTTPISQRRLSDINNDVFECKDRQQWLNHMAYCQWTKDEIKNGTAWEHIKNDHITFT